MNDLRMKRIILSMNEWTKDEKDSTKYEWIN